MVKTRAMPCLLASNGGLYKTVKFRNATYVGDPINAIKIFNEKEVDEIVVLDITATSSGRGPDVNLIRDIAGECFMPLCYGGGIRDVKTACAILELGAEKLSLNAAAARTPQLIGEIARECGSQAVVVSIDAKRNLWGKYEVMIDGGKKGTGLSALEFAKRAESLGAGELLLTAIDREGTWDGYDLELLAQVTAGVRIPVIANGGAGSVKHLADAARVGGASAVAMGSMCVFQKKGLGVLISFPKRAELDAALP
jgi:cyclase